MGLFTETQVTQGELGSFRTVRDVWPSETLGRGTGWIFESSAHSLSRYLSSTEYVPRAFLSAGTGMGGR